MRDAFITGGTGFLGSHLARELISRGRRVTVLDRNFSSERVRYLPRNADAMEVDITRPEEVRKALHGGRNVQLFHCAALDYQSAREDPALAFEVNVRGTWNVLEAARLENVEQTILVSTLETFGDHVRDPVRNDDAQYPRSLYGTTKVCMERLAEQFAREHKLDCRGLRLPTVMGPGRHTRSPSAFTSEIITAAALGKPYVIKASPKSSLPMMYVDDTVRGLCDLADAEASALSRRFYNVSGFTTTAEGLRRAVLQRIPVAHLEFAPNAAVVDSIAAVHDRYDEDLARRDWKWSMRYVLEDAVQRFTQAIRNPR